MANNNFKQAMKELLGSEPAPQAAAKKPAEVKAAPQGQKAAAPHTAAQPPQKPKPAASFLAPGTVFEGSLRCDGDVEIAGSFKGDITTSGTVMLRSNIQSNITAGSLNLAQCSLTGDVVAEGTVCVSEGSRIQGSVTAKELLCAGEITGDLKVSGNTALEEKAQINGSVVTNTLSVVKGAMIRGGIEMQKQ